jgi:hypothetical protein
MQLGMRRLVVFVSGAGLVAGACVFIACGSDSSSTSGGLPTVDAAGKDTGNNPPVQPPPPPPPVDTDGGDGGVDCTAVPKVRDNATEFYCAFVPKLADGGSASYCNNTQLCCNPGGKYSDGGFFDSFCAADTPKPGADLQALCTAGAAGAGSAYDGGSTFECADKNNCGAGQICVMTGTGITFATLNKNGGKDITGCGAVYAKTPTGSNLATKCCTPGAGCPGTGEYHLCGTTDTCAAGTCTPFSGFFRDLAYCK